MVPMNCPNLVSVAATRGVRNFGYKAATVKTAGAAGTAGLPGTGWGLGLGLGLGVWGPLTLVGLGVAGGFYYWAKYRTMHD